MRQGWHISGFGPVTTCVTAPRVPKIQAGESRKGRDMLGKNFLIGGIASVIFGVLALINPGVALFVLASGITILQVAANPYVSVLGKPETASSRLTVGSSPKTSSPTSASAMARRMAGVGRVTVSERRSITASG